MKARECSSFFIYPRRTSSIDRRVVNCRTTTSSSVPVTVTPSVVDECPAPGAVDAVELAGGMPTFCIYLRRQFCCFGCCTIPWDGKKSSSGVNKFAARIPTPGCGPLAANSSANDAAASPLELHGCGVGPFAEVCSIRKKVRRGPMPREAGGHACCLSAVISIRLA